MTGQEFYLQVAVVDYLTKFYPDVIFRSDLAGIKMTIGQAMKIKLIQKWRGWPDIIIYENAITENGHFYCGLAIELKLKRNDIYKKNNELRNEKHIKEQFEMLKKLNHRNYLAVFGMGFDDTKIKIDNYLSRRII